MKGWHFLRQDRKLQWHHEGPPIEPGRVLTSLGPIQMCKRGLHASVRPLDALKYAPGPVVCRVKLSGQRIKGEDKIVAERREVLWVYDATEVLQKFARMCALDVLHLWDAPEVVVQFLKSGENDAYAARAAYAAYAAAAARVATKEKQNRRLTRMLLKGRP